MEVPPMESVGEPPMARDFFQSASRDVSPQYRWARRSRRSPSSGDKEPNPSSLRASAQRPSLQTSPAPQVLNRTVSRSKRVEAGAPSPPPNLGNSSIKSNPRRALGAKPDGAASPRGPLDFPASPVSSPGSFKDVASPAAPVSSPGPFKDVASPAARLTPVRSRRSPSPQRWMNPGGPVPGPKGPPLSSSSSRGARGQAGAQGSSPSAVAPPKVLVVNDPVVRGGPAPQKVSARKEAVAHGGPAVRAKEQWNYGAGGKTSEAAGAAKPEVRGGGRSSTPFRRGLNAIKGRLFSDSRKSAAEEISRTQQDLVARHKVKPAASQGLKESLVHRLTRVLQRPNQPSRSRFLPAPPAPPPAAPVASPHCLTPPRLLEPPKPLAIHTPPEEQPHVSEEVWVGTSVAKSEVPKPLAVHTPPREQPHMLEEAWVGTGVAKGEAGPESGLQGDSDREAQSGDKDEEESDLGPERSPVVAGRVEEGAGVKEALWSSGQAGLGGEEQGSRQREERSSLDDSSEDSDSDSDSERRHARVLPRSQSAGTPASQPPRPSWARQIPPSASPATSWARHIPPSASPAASWDSQSSTEFANTRRPSLAQRLLSSESSGSEQGSPSYARSPLGSPRGASFGDRSTGASFGDRPTASHLFGSEQPAPAAIASPLAASSEGSLSGTPSSPPRPSPTLQAPRAAVRRSLDVLGWSSDEDTEEDRSARKREMASALRQLKSFQSGGTTPRPTQQPPLQRSFTDPAAFQVVRRPPSPMRTLWRQATAAAASLEGSAGSAKRLGLSAAGRALGRPRDPSPCPPGLLASPRRLRPEASPQRAPPQVSAYLFEDGPRKRESQSSGVAGVVGAPGRTSKTPSRGRRTATAAAAFFRSFTPGRQRPQVL